MTDQNIMKYKSLIEKNSSDGEIRTGGDII